MNRIVTSLLLVLLLISHVAHAGGFEWSSYQTYAFEDFGDFARRFPGLYPLDYGTLGAPQNFRPWNLAAWEFRVQNDGFPSNRRYDGLFDSNLQPVMELDRIEFSTLKSPAGTIETFSRTIDSDTTTTELFIREGYYNYGAIDFAHGQKVYKESAFELTGRLNWYDGLRIGTSASRLNHVRGRISQPLAGGWTGMLTYSGAKNDAEFPLHPQGIITEREEAILQLLHADSTNISRANSATFYVRKDREIWGSTFHAREQLYGWRLVAAKSPGGHLVALKFAGSIADIRFPGMGRHIDLFSSAELSDKSELGILENELSIGVRREDPRDWSESKDVSPRPQASFKSTARATRQFSLFAGTAYHESVPGSAWWNGAYRVSDRPQIIAQEFADTSRVYASHRLAGEVVGVDRYLTTIAGVEMEGKWGKASANATWIDARGDFSSHFHVDNDTIRIAYDKSGERRDRVGVSASGVWPIAWGFQMESDWFVELDNADNSRALESRSYSRLYFERAFFKAPLVIRSHVSYEHLGTRGAFSDRGNQVLPSDHIAGFRVSATIHGVTLLWGTENFFARHYDLLPGYLMIRKEEYLGVNWKLQL